MSIMRSTTLGTLTLALGLGGCATVGQDQFNTEVASLRAEIANGDREVSDRLGSRIAEVELRTGDLEAQLSAMEGELRALEREFDVTVERLEASVRFNTPVHFGFDRADIQPDHESLLDRFAAVVREHYPGALITVEGFTDPAGSESYNLALGQRRAEAVRSWLVGDGALVGERVRAVSYGEDTSRLVVAGAEGPGDIGRLNRRVVLVIEHAGGDRAVISEGEAANGGF